MTDIQELPLASTSPIIEALVTSKLFLISNERQQSAISLSFKGRAGEGMGWHDRTSELSILPPPSISPHEASHYTQV